MRTMAVEDSRSEASRGTFKRSKVIVEEVKDDDRFMNHDRQWF